MGITLRYIKPLFYWMPELYLILATIFYWVSTATLLNPIAFILLVLIVSQLIFNKKGMGIFLSCVFILLNLYLILALLSDLFKISVFSISIQKMFFIGAGFLTLNIIMSIVLLFKHINLNSKRTRILG
jgi:hypothetical protein|tara:strand:- start:217409 stop:217792 length:384 start_codon:yes stop_codon:yes gene_type:complete